MKKYIIIALSILTGFLGWEFLAAKLGWKKFTNLFASGSAEKQTAASSTTKTETVKKDGKEVLKVTFDKTGATIEQDGTIKTKDGWVILPDGTIIKPDGNVVGTDSEVLIQESEPRSQNLFSNIYNDLFNNTPAAGGRGTNNTPLEERKNSASSTYGVLPGSTSEGEQTT